MRPDTARNPPFSRRKNALSCRTGWAAWPLVGAWAPAFLTGGANLFRVAPVQRLHLGGVAPALFDLAA